MDSSGWKQSHRDFLSVVTFQDNLIFAFDQKLATSLPKSQTHTVEWNSEIFYWLESGSVNNWDTSASKCDPN